MSAAVDISVYTVREGALQILLIRRGNPPFKGMWALPGGYLNNDETAKGAAYRELTEETGIPREAIRLEPVGFYTEPERDPRGRTLSFSYMALIPSGPYPAAGGDAADARWTPVEEVLDETLPLAFDHLALVWDSLEQARACLEYTTIASAFCPREFTITELRRVYECVWGVMLDVRNFHRKITGVEGFLVPTGERTTRDGGRPAALYVAGEARRLQPPMYRPVTDGTTAELRLAGH